jgi:hypothetical protein
MPYAAAIVLVILWALGLMTGYVLGGLIHVLFIGAIVILVLRMARGDNALRRG